MNIVLAAGILGILFVQAIAREYFSYEIELMCSGQIVTGILLTLAGVNLVRQFL